MFAFLLLACTGSPPDDTADTADSGDPACHGDLAAGATEVVASGFEEGTEGISFVEGRLFVSHPGGVDEIVDGQRSALVELDSALGLAPAPGGLYVAAPGEFTLDGSGDDGSLLFVGLDGEVQTLGAGMPNPNFVATLGDTQLVSDDTAAIYTVRDGVVQTWTDAVPSPNGMVVEGDEVYVLSTFVQEPPLWRVPLSGGVPPSVSIWDESGRETDTLSLASCVVDVVCVLRAGTVAE